MHCYNKTTIRTTDAGVAGYCTKRVYPQTPHNHLVVAAAAAAVLAADAAVHVQNAAAAAPSATCCRNTLRTGAYCCRCVSCI